MKKRRPVAGSGEEIAQATQEQISDAISTPPANPEQASSGEDIQSSLGVTADDEGAIGDTLSSIRNAQATAENIRNAAAENIWALFGVTDDDRRTRTAVYDAQATAEHCAKCQRPLKPGDPVWRASLSLGRNILGGWQTCIAPVCGDCRSDWDRYRSALRCEGCRRPVHDLEWRPRASCFCSERCAAVARAARARHERRLARSSRSCERCGQTFEPKRADAKFCSVACKQAAYRRRAEQLKSRNALTNSDRVTANEQERGRSPCDMPEFPRRDRS